MEVTEFWDFVGLRIRSQRSPKKLTSII